MVRYVAAYYVVALCQCVILVLVRYGTTQHVAAPYGALRIIKARCDRLLCVTDSYARHVAARYSMLRYGALGHATLQHVGTHCSML